MVKDFFIQLDVLYPLMKIGPSTPDPEHTIYIQDPFE